MNDTIIRLSNPRGGKSQALIESLLSQAKERGLTVEVVYPETTTATTEDIDRLAHSKDVRVYGDYGAGWRDGVKAAAGLLATARTAPTDTTKEN